MRSSIKRLFSRWHLDNIKVIRRVIVSVVGVTILLSGIALLVLPGAFVVIPVGLAILIDPSRPGRETRSPVRRIPSSQPRMGVFLSAQKSQRWQWRFGTLLRRGRTLRVYENMILPRLACPRLPTLSLPALCRNERAWIGPVRQAPR